MENTDRLTLDRPSSDDFERFYEIHSDPQTNLFNPNGPMNLETAKVTFEEWLSHWDIHKFGSWTIKLKTTNAIVGFGGLSYRMYGEVLRINLGYRFDKIAWGNGFATEISKFAIDFGFKKLCVDKIFAVVRPKHMSSIKVLEKCNMIFFDKLDDVPNQENSLVYLIQK